MNDLSLKPQFANKIRKIIKDAGYNYKIRSWTKQCSNGIYEKVSVYAGRNIEKIASKRSRRLVAWKNEKGEWEGDKEAIKAQGGRGSAIYSLDYHDKTEPLKYDMWSDIDWNDDEEYAKNKLLKILENWRMVEMERKKLSLEEQEEIKEEKSLEKWGEEDEDNKPNNKVEEIAEGQFRFFPGGVYKKDSEKPATK